MKPKTKRLEPKAFCANIVHKTKRFFALIET